MPRSPDVALAVQLFEHGYSEEQVQVASSRCSTLKEALEFLGHEAVAASCPVAVPSPPREVPRRRIRKGQPLPSAPPALSSAAAASSGAAAKSSSSGRLSTSSVVQDPACQAIPIEETDASAWWSEATAAYRRIVQDLQSHLPEVLVLRDGSEPSASSAQVSTGRASELQTPTRKRVIEAEVTGDAAKRVRQGMQMDVKEGRPPATPQQVETTVSQPQQQASEDVKSAASYFASPSPNSICWNPQPATCTICCHDKGPKQTVQLGCRHGWYCTDCMERHAEARLELGDPCITCPECCQAIPERDLRRILPAQVVEKVLARSLERAVNATSDLWACPTPNCPMRVAVEEGMSARLQCTICKKTSCLRCGVQPYHRGMSCEVYARKHRGEASARQKDDTESLLQWIRNCGAKQCPTCRMAVTKQNLDCQSTQYKECHKMICRNCNTRFCFKCTAVLTDSYTCGCSINAHGFVDPRTGKRVEHLRKVHGRPRAKGMADKRTTAR